MVFGAHPVEKIEIADAIRSDAGQGRPADAERAKTDALLIDTWLMSCRVLGRGMEQFVLNTLVGRARKLGMKYVRGEYVPTPKNGMVKDHYSKLGFTPDGHQRWMLSVVDFIDRPVNIALERVGEPTGA